MQAYHLSIRKRGGKNIPLDVKKENSLFYNKSLKIPKGVIETVIRRTVHTVGKRTNNDQQNITQKTNDRATRTPLKTLDELVFSGRVSSSYSTCVTRRVTLVTSTMISDK
jgi:hypothetical protein